MRRAPWTFGSASEQREADLFWAELMGEPAPTRGRPSIEAEEFPWQPRRSIGPATLLVFQGAPGRGMLLEHRVRAAIVDAALTESARWHDTTGAPIFESNVAMFGNLVRYYLAVIRDVRPDTLVQLQAAAIAATTNYATLATTTNAATVTAEVQRLRGVLIAAAANTGVPANLATLVETALRRAREAHLDAGAFSAWSAVWVSHCVRSATITVGMEEFSTSHHGRNALLLPTTSHWEYAREAHTRRSASRLSTYHAFDPAVVRLEPGDIIVQDRRPNGGFTFAQMPPAAMITHGDIVVEVNANLNGGGDVVTLGGNLGVVDVNCVPTPRQESVRKRRFPLGADGRLVVSATQLFSQEDNAGNLPAVPAAIAATTGPMHCRSTGRIFTVLKPVGTTMDVPERPPGAGVLA